MLCAQNRARLQAQSSGAALCGSGDHQFFADILQIPGQVLFVGSAAAGVALAGVLPVAASVGPFAAGIAALE